MPLGYPILLDVSDKRIVIVGGGSVALRKATKLVEGGARHVLVVAPKFVEGFPPSVRKVTAMYDPAHLAAAALVFAATDSPEVNAEIVREARRRGALVSRADVDAESPGAAGDFTVPAVLKEGPVMVGVWADSPALAGNIRDGLRARWDNRWTLMAEAMRSLRPMILKSGLPPAARRELFRELATDAAMATLSDGGMGELEKWVMEKAKSLTATQTNK